MTLVKNILTRKGTTTVNILPTASVFEALQIMADKNIGSIVVKENERFLGVVTERDYSRKVVLKNKNSASTTVSEIMTSDLPSVLPEDTIDHCMEMMTKNNVRYLPVMVNDKLSGIISMSDVVKETILSQQQTINHLNQYIHS